MPYRALFYVFFRKFLVFFGEYGNSKINFDTMVVQELYSNFLGGSIMTLLSSDTELSLQQIIYDSHQRSLQYGLDPHVLPSCRILLSESELKTRINRYKEFISIATLFGSRIVDMLSDDGIVILISDHENCILEHFGDEHMRSYLTSINMVPGACFEESIGATSSTFLSLYHQRPISIVGKDHFHQSLHESACYSVPFSFEDEDIRGCVTIMTKSQGHSSYRMALLESIVESMKREYELKGINRVQKMVNNIINGKSSIGLIMINQLGSVTDYNFIAESMFNLPVDEVVGSHFHCLPRLSPYIEKSIAEQNSLNNIDFTWIDPYGKIKHCLADVEYMMDGSQYKGIYILVRDMTEKYELEQQMIVADRFATIGKLAAGLAHEIRNPLTSVMGFMQLVQAKRYEDENLNRQINIMYEELLRVKELVSDFVVVSKPSAPNRSACPLRSFLSDTVTLMESQSLLKNVDLKLNIAHDVPDIVYFDQSQIKQVLINTIQNAIEASIGSTGSVIIQCRPHSTQHTLTITVEDNGIGMDEQEMSQILIPFYTTKDNGTGLGMAVSYRIIENHDGNISISSKKDIGTKVEINLPYKVD